MSDFNNYRTPQAYEGGFASVMSPDNYTFPNEGPGRALFGVGERDGAVQGGKIRVFVPPGTVRVSLAGTLNIGIGGHSSVKLYLGDGWSKPKIEELLSYRGSVTDRDFVDLIDGKTIKVKVPGGGSVSTGYAPFGDIWFKEYTTVGFWVLADAIQTNNGNIQYIVNKEAYENWYASASFDENGDPLPPSSGEGHHEGGERNYQENASLSDILKKYPSAHQIEILLDEQGNRAGKKGFANQYAPELLKESTTETRTIENQFIQGSFGGPGRCRIYIPPGTTGFSAGAFDSQGGAGAALPPFRFYIPEGGLGMEPEDYEIKFTGGADGVSPQQMEALMNGESISPILGGGGYINAVPPIRFKRYLKKGVWILVDKLYGYNARFGCYVDFAYYSQEFPKLTLDEFGDPLMNPSSGGTGGDPNDGGNSGGEPHQPNPELLNYASIYSLMYTNGNKGFRGISIPEDGVGDIYGLSRPLLRNPPNSFRIYIPEGATFFGVTGFLAQTLDLPESQQYTVEVRLYLGAGVPDIEQEDVPHSTNQDTLPNIELLKSGGAQTFIHRGGGAMSLTGTWIFKTPCRQGLWLLVKYKHGEGGVQQMAINSKVKGSVYQPAFYSLEFDSHGDPLPTTTEGGGGGDGGNSGGGSTNPDPTPGTLPGIVELGIDTRASLVLSTTIWKRGDPTHITLRPKYSYHTLGALAIEPRGLLHLQSLSSSEASFTVDTSAVENLPVGLTTVKITSAELSCTLRILRITPTPETALTDDEEGSRSQESNPGPIEVTPPPSPSGNSDPVLTIQPLEGLSSFHTLLLNDVTREKWKELYRPEGYGISTEGSFSTLRYRTGLNSKMMYKIFVPPGVVSVEATCITYNDNVPALASAHFSRAPETNFFGPSDTTDTDDALSEILSGNTVRFYSPENAGVLVLFRTNKPLTQPSKLGGYIYIHFLQLPGAKVYDMSVRVKVDKAIYEQWYSSMDWSFISEPPTALYTIPA